MIMKEPICKSEEITPLPADPVVAMAYIPFQQYKNMYPAETALSNGTAFPELDKPFSGGADGRRAKRG